jgi:hypothetical protein
MENDNEFGELLDFEGLDNQPNTASSDFKAEFVAASLIENGYDPSRIILTREGAGKRGYAKDIEEISLLCSEHDLLDYLHIKTNREGIYDILPEGLFHQTINRKINKDKEEIVDEIKIHREEEFFARKFFRLFEIEMDHVLTDITLLEIAFDKRMSYSNYVNAFIPFWPVIELLERKQAVLFLHIVPILHRIRDSYAAIEASLSLILDVPVHLEPIILEKKDSNDVFESKLGDCRLGIDFILGNTFNDGLYDMKIWIGPMPALKMKQFLEGEIADRILNELCRLFIPSNVFIVKEYILDPEDSVFILSSEEKSTWLGINSYI